MRGIALDIESSGLNVLRHNVLEIGMVYFDLKDCGGIDQLDPKRDLIKFPCFRDELHLWPNIAEGIFWDMSTMKWHGQAKIDYFCKERERSSGNMIAFKIKEFIAKHYSSDDKPVLLGKNIGKFDWQLLMRITNGAVDSWFHHGFLDIGSVCFTPGKDLRVPSLDTLCQRYGYPRPSHTAIADCHAVINILERVTYDENVEG